MCNVDGFRGARELTRRHCFPRLLLATGSMRVLDSTKGTAFYRRAGVMTSNGETRHPGVPTYDSQRNHHRNRQKGKEKRECNRII